MNKLAIPKISHNFVSATRFSLFILVIALLIFSFGLSGADKLSTYEGMGFSFQYPEGWSFVGSGSHIVGNISGTIRDSISGSEGCEKIDITWMRDPGLNPGEVLNQIAKTYDQDGVEVLSKSQANISAQVKTIEVLDLYYKFKEYSARKRIAAWTSEESDRMFLVSMSCCSPDCSDENGIFEQILESFKDLDSKEISLDQRQDSDDYWAIMLGDLLSCYHYADQSSLSSTTISVETIHSLTPINGSYRLSSSEKIRSDMQEDVLIRAAVVQKILIDSGYKVELVQKSGRIWEVVEDPSGKWQSVSLNPKDVWRMIGVLVAEPGGCQGLIYDNATELMNDNSISSSGQIDVNDFMRKDCDPPRYVELQSLAAENDTWTDKLQSLLDGYSYPKKYQEDIFDCSNTSQICWAILEGKGYDSRLMFSYEGHPLGKHMWVVVRYPYDDRWVAIEATNTDSNGDLFNLGKIVTNEDYLKGIMYNSSEQFSRLNPEEGLWLKAG